MVDIKNFRKANNLKQQELAEYLGTTRSFISLIETGRSKLPDEMLAKLLTNNKGWDTSALTIDDAPKSLTATSTGGGNASVNIGSHNKVSASSELWEVKVQALNDKIELLKQQLEDKDRQIADKNGQIEFLKSLITK